MLREIQKLERKEKILLTAQKMIRAKGIQGLTMRALAGEAGVSLATPYNLFGSKAEIIRRFVDESSRTIIGRLEENPPKDPIEYILTFAQLGIEVYGEDAEFYMEIFRGLLSMGYPLHPSFKEIIEVWRIGIDRGIEYGYFEKNTKSDLMAVQLHIIYRGALTLWVELEDAAEEIPLHILYGVLRVLLSVATYKGKSKLTPYLDETDKKLAEVGPVA